RRVIWTAVLMVVVILVNGAWRELRDASAKTWAYLALAGVLITANWGIYVLAVNTDHVADAALGYFINPLLSVLLATLVLRETLRKRQVQAIAVAAVGVVVLIFLAGQPPVMALGMALTFAFYGLIKKQISVSATASVAAETLVVAPAGVAYLVWLSSRGESTFLSEGPAHAGMLMLAGVVTALPLLFYGSGAKQLPLTTIGMLQYITPTMQMLWALFITQEYLSPARWLGYVIIWVAVAIYVSDLLVQRRERRSATG
ncbi:EamA family transporter RarD, partial [Corynebacterium sp.]|uniref:EamA family transporter RarD n=1 Tax=Corynebacterium sp. TaxID=1720 RepID=UPI0037360A39